MTLTDWVLAIIIIFLFLGNVSIQAINVNLSAIKKDWPKYRCNPIFMPFSKQFGVSPSDNFVFCIQDIGKNIMGYILKPIEYSLSLFGTFGFRIQNAVQAIRKMINKIRVFSSTVFGQIYGLFLNILIEFQQMIIAIRDMMSKLMGIMVSFMYILSGSIYTMQSLWKGPPGQLLRGLCFHPNTKVKLKNGIVKEISKIQNGDILKNNETVFVTMQIKNTCKDNKKFLSDLYELKGENTIYGENKILVSGSHLVKYKNNFIQVYKHPDAKLSLINNETLTCLITDKHTIPIGDYIFGDWEDNGALPWELEHTTKK